jgi:hypothetical protein
MTYFAVSKKGKWLNFCSLHTHKIPNIVLFLKLVERLCPRLLPESGLIERV